MSEPPRSPADDPPIAAPVEVSVTRTGGFGGITKRWVAEPAAAEASVFIDLIAQCPWDAPAAAARRDTNGDGKGDSDDTGRSRSGAETPAAPSAGADRFVWWIRARCGEQEEREAELPEDDMVGAWRALVDAVREWSPDANA